MTAIWKRDARGFFFSPIGYVFISAFLLIMNLFFFAGNVLSASSDLSPVFSNMLLVLMFLVPILTMRLFSEEYKSRTDQLLLTAPISIWEIVTGKFLAAMTVMAATLLCTLPWVVVILIYGVPAWPSIIGSYVAVFCASACFIAMGLFLSALTESQVIAAVLSFALFMGIWILNTASAAISIDIVKTVIEWFSLFTRYQNFTNGIFALGDIVFFISFAGIFLFFTSQVVSAHRK